MDKEIYNDPIISKRRKGDLDNPFLNITESLQIVKGRVVLTEIPNRFNRVSVTGSGVTWSEIEDGQLKDNLYRVDYAEGVVFFDAKHNTKTLTFEYLGEGVHYFPADRTYIKEITDRDVLTMKDKVGSIDTAILEQKNRVDQLVKSTSQPSEMVDIRTDKNGVVFPVARDRINAEQAKIENAQRDANGKTYASLNERINAEQVKVEDAFIDKNGRNHLGLDKRINAEQAKIEEAYKGADGATYASLKSRHDKTDEKTASLKRRIVNTVAQLKTGAFLVGEFVKTLGYAAIEDQGAGEYVILNSGTKKPTDIILNNGMWARLITLNGVNPLQFGAKGNNEINDNSVFVQIEGSYSGIPIDLKGKTYVVDSYPTKNLYMHGYFRLAEGLTAVAGDYSNITRTGNNTSIYLGKDAGKNSLLYSREMATVGSYNNIGIGFEAMLSNVKGYRNTAIGFKALRDNVEGYYNVAIGDYALHDTIGIHTNADSDTGSRNTAVGTNSGRFNTTGRKNVYVGRNAGHASTVGNHNTAVGYNAYSGQVGGSEGRHDVKTAHNNTVVGYNAAFNTNADYNHAFGSFALYSNETGKANIAIGHQSNSLNVHGSNNVTIGVDVMRNHNDDGGHDNTSIGTQSLLNIKKGHSNTAIGRRALATTIAGNPAVNFSGSIGLGANSRISGSYQCQLGNSAVTTYVYGAVQNRSDMRDKVDIRDTVLGLDFIKKLRPVDFKWDYRDDYIEVDPDDGTVTKLPKDGSKKGSRYHHGLIAQEVKALIDATGTDFGGFQDHQVNGGEDLYTIGYEELIGPLVKAVQELSKRLDTAETEIKALKAK